jgi:hypothetical protein
MGPVERKPATVAQILKTPQYKPKPQVIEVKFPKVDRKSIEVIKLMHEEPVVYKHD